jgi:hypothetical protein
MEFLVNNVKQIHIWYHNSGDWLLGLGLGREKELFRLPIENGCTASRAIYDEEFTCWRKECPNHECSDETN